MKDATFECDDEKAKTNLAAHGVSFESARDVFLDPFAVDWFDEREDYGEDRYATIGMTSGRLIFVAYTMRDARIRLISARGAEPFERRIYGDDGRGSGH